jgi:hypothetical protein
MTKRDANAMISEGHEDATDNAEEVGVMLIYDKETATAEQLLQKGKTEFKTAKWAYEVMSHDSDLDKMSCMYYCGRAEAACIQYRERVGDGEQTLIDRLKLYHLMCMQSTCYTMMGSVCELMNQKEAKEKFWKEAKVAAFDAIKLSADWKQDGTKAYSCMVYSLFVSAFVKRTTTLTGPSLDRSLDIGDVIEAHRYLEKGLRGDKVCVRSVMEMMEKVQELAIRVIQEQRMQKPNDENALIAMLRGCKDVLGMMAADSPMRKDVLVLKNELDGLYIAQFGEDPEDKNNLCCVCMGEQPQYAFVPCGHMSTCEKCTRAIMGKTGKCPCCRMACSDMIRIYN